MKKGDQVVLLLDYKSTFNYKKGQTGKILFPVRESDITVVVELDGYEKEKESYLMEIKGGKEGPNEVIWCGEFPIELITLIQKELL